MIARLWHGKTAARQAEDYLKLILERAIPDYESIAGNRGVTIMRRIEGEEAHFLILTLWESRAAIEAFAGADIENMVNEAAILAARRNKRTISLQVSCRPTLRR